jgi:hypothetical protein
VFHLEEGNGSEAEEDNVGCCEEDGGRCVLRGEEGVCEKFEEEGLGLVWVIARSMPKWIALDLCGHRRILSCHKK